MQLSKVLNLNMQFKQLDILASMVYATSTIATTATETPLG